MPKNKGYGPIKKPGNQTGPRPHGANDQKAGTHPGRRGIMSTPKNAVGYSWGKPRNVGSRT